MQGQQAPSMSRPISWHTMMRPSIGLAAGLVLLIQGCMGRQPAVPPAQRTIRLADGGSVSVERKTSQGRSGEQVSVSDRNGQQVSLSWCTDDTGSYDQLVTLFTQVQKAVAANDRPAVARLIRFPLQVNGGTSESINGSSAFLQQYGRIFSPTVVRTIAEANPQAVFCRSEGAMFGDGVVWANSRDGRVAIEVVNR